MIAPVREVHDDCTEWAGHHQLCDAGEDRLLEPYSLALGDATGDEHNIKMNWGDCDLFVFCWFSSEKLLVVCGVVSG